MQNCAKTYKIYLARPEFSWILAACLSTTSMAIFSNPLFASYSVYARNASFVSINAELLQHLFPSPQKPWKLGFHSCEIPTVYWDSRHPYSCATLHSPVVLWTIKPSWFASNNLVTNHKFSLHFSVTSKPDFCIFKTHNRVWSKCLGLEMLHTDSEWKKEFFSESDAG